MKNFTWGHGVVVALLSFMLFILSMVFLFPNGQKNAEMVSDNYYEEELLYQDVIDAKNRADTVKLRPEYSQDQNGIKITFPKNINNGNAKVNFVLNRTEDKNLDIKKEIILDANNAFLIPSNILVKGSYTLQLTWIKDKNDYRIDYDVAWK